MAEHSFSMYLEYSFRKTDWLCLITGIQLDPHFSYILNIHLENLIRHVRWLDVIWTQ